MAIPNNFGQETINIGQEITSSLLGVVYTIIDWIPRIIGVLIILIIGHYLAKGVKHLIKKVLKAIKFEDFMVKLKVTDMIKSQGVSLTISDIAIWLIYWLVFLAFISAAADVLAVPSITNFIAMVISYIPAIFAGLIIILLGIIAANTLSNFVKNFKGGDTYKQLVRWFILIIAFILMTGWRYKGERTGVKGRLAQLTSRLVGRLWWHWWPDPRVIFYGQQ